MRAAALAVGWATALGATAAAAGTAAAAPGAAAPPNFVIVLTDDQDVLLSSLSYMPKLKKLVADEGMTFAWAFDAVPVCCPSRSSLWTGRLQHNTKVTNNSIEGNCASLEWQAGPEKQNLAALLKAAGGYKTFYGGKFLNNYGFPAVGGVKHIPPGMDDWQGLVGNSAYYGYTLSNNGQAEAHGSDYATDYLPDLIYNRSLRFLDGLPPGAPFLTVLSTPSCHQPADPAPQYAGLYPGIKAPRQPNFNTRIPDTHWFEESMGGVGAPLDDNALTWVDLLYRRRLQTLATVDDIVEGLVGKLEAMGVLNNTFILFLADNGYHLGEAGLSLDKRQPWDYDARTPLLIRGPGVPRGVVSTAPVSHVDIAPTVLQLAGAPVPSFMDGLPLTPLLLSGAGALTADEVAARLAAAAGPLQLLPEGDPAVGALAGGADAGTQAALDAAGWTRDTIFYSYHGENMAPQPACVAAGVTDPALMCWPQNNGSLTVGPFPPPGFKTFCSCQDATNNTYACLRTVNATSNFRYCEFLPPAPAAAGAGEGQPLPAAAPVAVEFFDITADPYEMTNAAASLDPGVAAELHARLTALRTCAGAAQCNQF